MARIKKALAALAEKLGANRAKLTFARKRFWVNHKRAEGNHKKAERAERSAWNPRLAVVPAGLSGRDAASSRARGTDATPRGFLVACVDSRSWWWQQPSSSASER